MNEELSNLLAQPDEMGRPKKPITEQDIQLFEDMEHVRLPDDFRSFLLEYGARDLNSRRIFAFKSKAKFADGKRKTISVGAISGPLKMLETRKRYVDPANNNSGPIARRRPIPTMFGPWTSFMTNWPRAAKSGY
nr:MULTISPECIES: SMI1/KNR4 family protein [unclassified Rhizobium]